MLKYLRLLPKNLISRIFGIAALIYIPSFLRRLLYRKFAQIYNINIDEASNSLEHYTNFNHFFTRRLKKGVRPIAKNKNALISPVDGILASFGKIKTNALLQAKGIDYSLDDLLKNEEKAKFFHNGFFLTIYLSPSDYHRVHAPVTGDVEGYAYIPGNLWPVNKEAVLNIKNLFAINERVVTYQRCKAGGKGKNNEFTVASVLVGAMNVGKLHLSYANFQANSWWRKGFSIKTPKNPIHLKAGEEQGIFELGSTVILLLPKGKIKSLNFSQGEKVKMGQTLGQMIL